jgi:hypothetical protein
MARRASDDATQPVVTTWVYPAGMVFTFVGQPTFATARIAPGDEQTFGDIVRTAPALWRMSTDMFIDSLATQLVRFRGRADSVEVLFAARPDVAAIQSRAEVVADVRADFWLLAGGTVTVARDSIVPAVDTLVTFRRTLEPRTYTYRAEATSVASSRAGRAAASFIAGDDRITGFTARGFGMSDVLVATRANELRNATIRWSDLDVVPLVGAARRDTPLSLVWENYDLANDAGSSRYSVQIALVRDNAAAGRIAARILGRLGSAVGITSTEDRVTLTFERAAPFRSVQLDNVSVSLGETPPGTYVISVEVTDLVSGRKTSRWTNLRVTDR